LCKEQHGRQLEVAGIIGTTPSTVSDWFHGRKQPTSEQILLVLKFLKRTRKKRSKGGAEEMEFRQ
jgi:transcriptional regulator with XRE-family HTH domain